MKKLLSIALVGVMAFAGCKSLPSEEKMQSTAYAVGCASGMVANETKIDDKSRTTVIEVVTIVQNVVPQDGQTFQEVWTLAATEYVQKLVAEGKLDQSQATLVVGGVTIAGTGLDYVFSAYPKARQYEKLVAAAIKGFSSGFLTTFKPVNADVCTKAAVKYDKDAYKYLKSKFIQ